MTDKEYLAFVERMVRRTSSLPYSFGAALARVIGSSTLVIECPETSFTMYIDTGRHNVKCKILKLKKTNLEYLLKVHRIVQETFDETEDQITVTPWGFGGDKVAAETLNHLLTVDQKQSHR